MSDDLQYWINRAKTYEGLHGQEKALSEKRWAEICEAVALIRRTQAMLRSIQERYPKDLTMNQLRDDMAGFLEKTK